MNKNKLMMYTLTGVLGIGLSIGGATFALFTSSATNEGNSVTTGTIILKAKRDHGDYVPGPMFYTDYLDPAGKHPYDVKDVNPSGEAIGGWAPGDKIQRTMILTNEGSLDAKITGLKASFRTTYSQNVPVIGERAISGGLTSGDIYDEFISKANVKVSIPDEGILLYDGPLSGLISTDTDKYTNLLNNPVLMGTEPPFEPGPLNVTFELSLDKTASNKLQGQTFIFDFGFFAEQVKYND
ncbi:SipW-dependent-type signal peptide-containing protein [Neobacillus kokaensis]|uniref:SipW-dependent-type signal peptide-containing protein n=1 Tax=Neobacillus kokaensis TaxID=2759023 RepID=UPI00174C23F7|nr:SipW-dependent-type signal peptide-containing protein [Neobacillus kokaensis]